MASWNRGGGGTLNIRQKKSIDKVEERVVTAGRETKKTLREAAEDLMGYMEGPKSDTLLLLLATALVTPLCKKMGTSPILGFLAAGMLLGPNALGLISGIHKLDIGGVQSKRSNRVVECAGFHLVMPAAHP